MTPSEELKAAADQIRETARAATPEPWRWIDPGGGKVKSALVSGFSAARWEMVLPAAGGDAYPTSFDAAHIALWDPAAALLVADLLYGMAAHWETRPIGDLDIYLATPPCKLARHILGRTT